MVEDTLNLIAHSIWEIKFCSVFYFGHFFDQTHRLRDIEGFLEIGFRKYASPVYHGIVIEIGIP